MGFQGYPTINIGYFGETEQLANGVSVTFILEEGSAPQEERFNSKDDAREDEVIQSALVKMMERSGAKTVTQDDGITISA